MSYYKINSFNTSHNSLSDSSQLVNSYGQQKRFILSILTASSLLITFSVGNIYQAAAQEKLSLPNC